MATIFHFPSFSCAYRELSTFLHSFNLDQHHHHHHLSFGTAKFPNHTHFISASASTSTINSSSVIKKVRVRKRVKSNVELCDELREFVSIVGLPEGHVPTWKELTEHGRKDLANIVRRRGYKLIKELLTSPIEGHTVTSTENQESDNGYENLPVEVQNEHVDILTEIVSAPSEDSISGNYDSALSEDSISANYLFTDNGIEPLISDTQSTTESLTSLSLQEKAAKFVQDGELDSFEGQVHEVESTFEEKSLDYMAAESSPVSEIMGNTTVSEAVAPTEYSANWESRDEFLSPEELDDSISHGTLELDAETSETENQDEIDRLKLMLHQKELELSKLKELIEKEKIALSILQDKAEKEIGKSQEMILAKDEELQAVEESLSGLKEVQIEFLGHCENVEVAGSFNGWHHPIKMEQLPSATTVSPTGSRKSSLWSTSLWLYPGIYEIKFVVDGHWVIDHQRESVTRGSIHNNILRVE